MFVLAHNSGEVTVLVVTEGEGPHTFLVELARNPRYRPVGRVTSTAAAVEAVDTRRPAVVLAEVVSLERIVELGRLQHRIGPRLVVVCDMPLEVALLPCLEAGARGFVCSPVEQGLLDQAVTHAAEGSVFLDPRSLGWLVEVVLDRCTSKRDSALTLRQAQIIDLVRNGLSNRDIASLLGVSTETVKSHVHRAMRSLGVHDRWEAAARLQADRSPSG